MTIFSKVLSLLLVSVLIIAPSFARDHKKCDLVGSYTGSIGDNFVEAQFNEGGTVTIYFVDSGTGSNFAILVGSWKCAGHKCFKFCVVNSFGVKLSSEICFTNHTCNHVEGTVASPEGLAPFVGFKVQRDPSLVVLDRVDFF